MLIAVSPTSHWAFSWAGSHYGPSYAPEISEYSSINPCMQQYKAGSLETHLRADVKVSSGRLFHSIHSVTYLPSKAAGTILISLKLKDCHGTKSAL